MARTLRCGLYIGILIVMMTGVCRAQDPAVVDIFKNGFYGGLAGILVGAAALAFTDEPEDHLNFIPIGAGIGVIGGTAYGIYTATRYGLFLPAQPLAEINRSQIVLRLPMPQIQRGELNLQRGASENQYRLTLLRLHF